MIDRDREPRYPDRDRTPDREDRDYGGYVPGRKEEDTLPDRDSPPQKGR